MDTGALSERGRSFKGVNWGTITAIEDTFEHWQDAAQWDPPRGAQAGSWFGRCGPQRLARPVLMKGEPGHEYVERRQCRHGPGGATTMW